MDEMKSMDKCKSCKYGVQKKKFASDLSYGISLPASNLYDVSDDSVVHLRKQNSQMELLQLNELKDMVRHLKLMSNTIAETNSEDELQMEWNYLAKIIDRTCRVVFLLMMIMSHVIRIVLYVVNNPYFEF